MFCIGELESKVRLVDNMNMNNNNKNKTMKKKPRNNENQRKQQLRSLIPKSRRYNCVINISGLITDTTPTGWSLLEIRVNDLFAPSATAVGVGSALTTTTQGATAGFDEYSIAHLEDMFAHADLVSNVTGTGSFVSCGFSDLQPSTVITTYSLAQMSEGAKYSTGPISLGETNANSANRLETKVYSGVNIVGRSSVYKGSLNYDGSGTVAPNQALWFRLVNRAYGTGVINAVLVNINLYLGFTFYSPKILI